LANSFIKLSDFIDLKNSPTKDHFKHSENLLDYLGPKLTAWLEKLLASFDVKEEPLSHSFIPESATVIGAVYIEKDVLIEPGAFIMGPCFIGQGSEVRHTAYIRGNSYIGRKCNVGHATEVKGSIFFDGAKAGHFAYVGDSILGQNVNLGAGTKLANLKMRGDEVKFIDPNSDKKISSGLRKFGSIVGDDAQTGCNAVLSPGSLLLPKTAFYPCFHYQGTLKSGIAR